MSNTPEQDACINQLDGPIDVSAGAGSGKTYTLTQRIAAALSNPESGVESISQVCAITFTKKAATELKSRVRALLRERGLFEEALKVDDAWISTIHGMCSRILKASALELGIDPEFRLDEGQEIKQLRNSAIEQALQICLEEDSPIAATVREMVVQFGARKSKYAFEDNSLNGKISTLMYKANELPGGFDDINLIVGTKRGSCDMRVLYEETLNLQQVFAEANQTATMQKNSYRCEANIANFEKYFNEGDTSVEAKIACLSLLEHFNKQCAGDIKDAIGVYEELLAKAQLELISGYSETYMEALIKLARLADALFSKNKRQHSLVDNSDLIRQTYFALQRPTILSKYKDRFRMVMVDEFQDTDALQLAIVDLLCGEGRKYLCTVGDAQQSIYAFRGADVDTYRSYRASYNTPELEKNKLFLTKNFRSHPDVLAFVKQVCAKPAVFGSEFLDLSAGRKEFIEMSAPRVQVGISLGKNVEEQLSGVIQDVVEYFTQMKAQGYALSDMALLMGKMTNAQLFASALQKAGFECVITGGTQFANAKEAIMVAALGRALTNPKDTDALVKVLTGPLFRFTPADLLCFATKQDENSELSRLNIGKGLASVIYGIKEENEIHALAPNGQVIPDDVCHALLLINKAHKLVRTHSLSVAIDQVLKDSGWLGEMQEAGPEGSASIGNAYKAVRIVREIEKDTTSGPLSAALVFQNMIDGGIREAPGALNIEKQESISIMTIHMSKGLEFPVVAVVDFDKKIDMQTGLVCQKLEGKQFAFLDLRKIKCGDKEMAFKADQLVNSVDCANTISELKNLSAFEQKVALEKRNKECAIQENQRLFYVAATRAEQALGIFAGGKKSKNKFTFGLMTEAVVHAFFAEDEVTEGNTVFTLESGAAMPFSIRAAAANDTGSAVPCSDVSGNAESEVCTTDTAGTDALSEMQCEKANEPYATRVLPIIDEVKPAYARHMENSYESNLFSYSAITHEVGEDTRSKLSVLTNAKTCVVDLSHMKSEDVCVAVRNQAVAATEDMPFVRRQTHTIEDDDIDVATPAFTHLADSDKATDFGSALHRLCQLAAVRGKQAARNAVHSMVQTYGVKDEERLVRALDRWLKSNVAKRAYDMPHIYAEHPFCVNVGTHVMQGEIDLLCVDDVGAQNNEKHAFVVDYKTGGHANETAEQLCNKHVLQAACYAYALLKDGFTKIDFAFARVEQDDPTGSDSLQSVTYHFGAENLREIEETLKSIVG